MRPFGNAILDGYDKILKFRCLSVLDKDCSVDLDLEQGSGSYWPAFVNQIRSHASGDNKTFVWIASTTRVISHV
jgi:hypothetical protein